jgi:uncharacterized protein (TIGR02996 family)
VGPDSDSDDDAARLVIADELVERGDPRGELIQVQIALAKLPLEAPAAAPLIRRQDELLHSHGPRWARALGSRTHRHRFRRGFIEDIAVPTDTDITDELLTRERIRGLRINQVVDGRLDHPLFARLRRLEILRVQRGASGPTGALALPQLEELGFVNMVDLSVMTRLRSVVLGDTDEVTRQVLALPALRELNIFWGNRSTLAILVADPRLARLESIEAPPHAVFALVASPHFRPRRLAISSRLANRGAR